MKIQKNNYEDVKAESDQTEGDQAQNFDQNFKSLVQFLFNYWGLDTPELIFSVTGAAQSLNTSNELKLKFKEALIKAAKTTKAWIITGGTNCGVMKLVGVLFEKREKYILLINFI